MGKLVYLLFGLILFGFLSTGVFAQVNLVIYPQPVYENSPQKLTCTYLGAGISSVKWWLGNQTIGVINIANNACQIIMPPNSTLYSYTCSAETNTFTLTILNVTRSNNGQMWSCSISDVASWIHIQSVTPDIIVPISNVTMIQPVTDVVTVLVDTIEIFVCETSGGLPAAQVTWFKDSGTVDNITVRSSLYTSKTSDNLIIVTSKLIYLPQKSDRNMRIYCMANNSRSTILISNRKPLIDVQYPPESPPFIRQETLNATGQNLYVIERTRQMLSCSVTGGNPLANLTWNCYNGSITDRTAKDTVTKEVSWSASREQDGSCTCVSSHYNWYRSVSTRIEILYAPVVHSLANEDIAEGRTLTKVCDVTPGNPSTTTFAWKKVTDNRTWRTQILSIINVSRSNASYYTCTANNMMSPTVGSDVIGEDSKSFFLNVWYSSSITLFTLNGFQESCIVSENDTDLPVICDVDSNPGSVITIQHDGMTIWTQIDAKQLKYSLERAKCTDAGYYRCFGSNAYNSQPAVKEIRLFVKCSPRPSPYVQLIDRVRTGLHRSITLEFSALSYPEPTAFKWFKVTDLALLPIENTDNTLISSKAVNTSLTIVNVTESSFGKYLLIIHNERGVWNQSYYMEAYDKPEPPNDFKSLDEKATISSVTLQWIPGFNGGQPQTFVLQYKMKETEQWLTVNIPHHNETMMNYMIQPLSSGTQYEVVVFAFNSIGNSTQSQRKTVSTNAADSRPGNTGAVIGGAVGGGTACVIVVAVAIIIIRRIRMWKGNCEKQSAQNNTTAIYTDLQTSQHEYTNMTSEYCELKTRSASTFEEGVSDPYTKICPENSSMKEHIYNAIDSTSKAVPEDAKVYVNLQIRRNQPSS